VPTIVSPKHSGDAVEVRHNEAASRFEAEVDGGLCVANYRLVDGVMRIHHTEVPPRLEGRGIASRIVSEAFAYAQAHGLAVEPWCSFVRNYMRQHPDTQKLLPAGFTLGR
jgi:predicted GNAT family acetyltransferase